MSAIASRKTRLLPGFKPVLELLRNSPDRIAKLYCKMDLREFGYLAELASKANIPVELVSQRDLDLMCKDANHIAAHQGVAAMLASSREISFSELLQKASSAPLPLVLALDQIKDPGNLGTLARTAWALGAGGIVIPEHESAKPGPAAWKSSAGALELIPLCEVTNLAKALDAAEEAGFAIYGTTCSDNSPRKTAILDAFHLEWKFPAVLALGSESKGLRPGVQKRCNWFLRIPFARSFDSLNIAQAGAILLGLCAACHSNSRD